MEGRRNCYADEHYLPTFFSVSTITPFVLYLIHEKYVTAPAKVNSALKL